MKSAIKDIWCKLNTSNCRSKQESPDYWQFLFINNLLTTMILILAAFVLINVVLYVRYEVVLLDGCIAIAATLVLLYLRRTNNVKAVSIITVVLIIVSLIVLLHITENRHFAFYWLAVFPPIAYYLLGRKLGVMITIPFFLYILIFILTRYRSWEPAPFSIESIFNICGVSIALMILVSHYESSRKAAYIALEKKSEELGHLAVTDSLTGLYNRSRLDGILKKEIAGTRKNHQSFSVILGDIDNFKYLNDKYGHLAGDIILIELAGILQKSCRDVDTLGRWGGDEFLFICTATDKEKVYVLAERIRSNVEQHDFKNANNITISLGTYTYKRGDDAYTVIKAADKALYRAKLEGRNRVAVY